LFEAQAIAKRIDNLHDPRVPRRQFHGRSHIGNRARKQFAVPSRGVNSVIMVIVARPLHRIHRPNAQPTPMVD